jgi:hypothetical protein
MPSSPITIALRNAAPILVPPSGNGAGPSQKVYWFALFTGPVESITDLSAWVEPMNTANTGLIHPEQSEVLVDLLDNLARGMAAVRLSPPSALFPISAQAVCICSGISDWLFPLASVPQLKDRVTAIANHALHRLKALDFMHDPVPFVDGLEQVDIASIPDEDMCCPHCWLPFGTTYEDNPAFEFMVDPVLTAREVAFSEMPFCAGRADDNPLARQVAFRELPFCAGRADNNPVRTPCSHLYGRSCLIDHLENVDTLCPCCRQEMVHRGLSGRVGNHREYTRHFQGTRL